MKLTTSEKVELFRTVALEGQFGYLGTDQIEGITKWIKASFEPVFEEEEKSDPAYVPMQSHKLEEGEFIEGLVLD